MSKRGARTLAKAGERAERDNEEELQDGLRMQENRRMDRYRMPTYC